MGTAPGRPVPTAPHLSSSIVASSAASMTVRLLSSFTSLDRSAIAYSPLSSPRQSGHYVRLTLQEKPPIRSKICNHHGGMANTSRSRNSASVYISPALLSDVIRQKKKQK